MNPPDAPENAAAGAQPAAPVAAVDDVEVLHEAAHLLALGHPIVGDALYGAPDTASRLMLHACALRLEHPVSGHTLDLRSDVPF